MFDADLLTALDLQTARNLSDSPLPDSIIIKITSYCDPPSRTSTCCRACLFFFVVWCCATVVPWPEAELCFRPSRACTYEFLNITQQGDLHPRGVAPRGAFLYRVYLQFCSFVGVFMLACLRPPPSRPLDSSYKQFLTLKLFTEEFYRSTLQRPYRRKCKASRA